MHGYELIQQIEEKSGGVWGPSPGSIYPTLQLLADEGLLACERVEGGKAATLTDAGRAYVEAPRYEPPAPRDETPAGSGEARDLGTWSAPDGRRAHGRPGRHPRAGPPRPARCWSKPP